MNTIENNKLIAEFLGYKKSIGITYHKENKIVTEKSFKFDTDWNWLIQVVDKIECIEKGRFLEGNLPNKEDWESNNFGATNIEQTYKDCLEFIKLHNQQNQ